MSLLAHFRRFFTLFFQWMHAYDWQDYLLQPTLNCTLKAIILTCITKYEMDLRASRNSPTSNKITFDFSKITQLNLSNDSPPIQILDSLRKLLV